MTYTDAERQEAHHAFKAAAERYLQVWNDDDTMLLEGLVSMAMGSGATSGERLSSVFSGSKVAVAGLAVLLDRDVAEALDDWEDRS